MREQEIYTLNNGLEVRWWPTEDPIISANLIIRAGSLHEQPGEEGLAHFLEHCVGGAGAPGFTPARDWSILREELGYGNWTTGPQMTIGQGSFLPERFPLFIEYVARHALEPAFDPLGVETERRAVLREMADYQAKQDPRARAVSTAIYRDHPIQRETLGNEAVVRDATIDDLRALHARGYCPANMVLIIAGPRPADARQRIEDAFGPYESGARSIDLQIPFLSPIEKTQIFRYKNSSTAHGTPSAALHISAVVPPDGSEHEATVAMLSSTLNNADRLTNALRFSSGISYGVGSQVNGNLNTGVLTVSSNVDATRVDEALVRIVHEFNRLQEEPLSPEDLVKLKYSARYSAASALMGPLGKLRSMFGEITTGKSTMQYLDDLTAVTSADIQRVAQEYLPRNLDDRHVTSVWSPLEGD